MGAFQVQEATVHEELTVIPVFPLEVVVLPGEALPLHIFEGRYKAMVADCRSAGRSGRALPFGVSLAQRDSLCEVGCTVSLERVVREYDDGRLDILTVGRRRYRVVRISEERPYLQAVVEFLRDDVEDPDTALRERAHALAARLTEILTGEPALSFTSDDAPPSFQLAAVAGFDLKGRQGLLEMRSENFRLAVVAARLAGLIARVQDDPRLIEGARPRPRLHIVN